MVRTGKPGVGPAGIRPKPSLDRVRKSGVIMAYGFIRNVVRANVTKVT
jgi:hypothetical protein